MTVASIHAQKTTRGNTYRVLWRADGRQRSLTFENLPSAERFKTLLEDHGPDEALRVIELDEIGKHVPTVTEWLTSHIDNLTGVQPATINRYRTYVRRDVNPVFGSLPISAVTETTIARWIKQLGGSGKTIANKHGFLSGAFNGAVRAGGVMATNPCAGRRLPHTRVEETVFLTPAEFKLLRDHIERDRWKNLATWLVTTGMRFSEATALSAADIDAEAKNVPDQQGVEVLRGGLPARDRTAQDQEVDPHHQPATLGARGDRPDRPPRLPVHERRRKSRPRAGVLQRRLEARSSGCRGCWIDEGAACARSTAHVRVLDDPGRRAAAGDSAAPRARVDSDDDWGCTGTSIVGAHRLRPMRLVRR